jgi:hypothetical protein
MRYRINIKDNSLSELHNLLLKDKEIQTVTGNGLKKEINKEIETWLQYGKIKPYYAKNYSPELIKLIMSIINKYHKKYKALWEQGELLEKKYEAYEMTMAQVQEEKNKLYEDIILPELNKLLKEQGFIK